MEPTAARSIFRPAAAKRKKLEFVGNNNLVQTVLALEHVFDDTKIFKKSKQSLRQLGKHDLSQVC